MSAAKTYITGETYPVKDQLKSLGCRWDGDKRAWYAETPEVAEKAQSIVKPPPMYNSPPPQDLGTVDPAALAARHGREAVAGAQVLSFTGHGQPVDPDGAIVRSKGKSYVQVAAGKPRYYSRDMLEDFDMFDDEPGWQWQRDVVEVELSEPERAADQAKADAKAARERALAALKAAEDRIWKEGERPAAGEVRKVSEGPGTETIDHGKPMGYSSPDTFVITSSWIWYERYNGRDGDDWSWNNYHGFIIQRLPFDPVLAGEIRAAAKLLGYKRSVEKGDPPRTEIRTEHGRVYQRGCEGNDTAIDWTPPEPLYGHEELTRGWVQNAQGEDVVTFAQRIKKGKKEVTLSARIAGRPDLAELVKLAEVLRAELKAHYAQEA
jgi:hypothetical protein